ncbi:ADP-ribosylglycohydrolase family protein [Thiohalorhabdus sp.]|uniref:ADP-ribosylglycohydrolase family protein n=1 Tax=Thiohalorhabdus sp. TaxID=3094134 RepID=UPI002FC332CA
MGSDSLRIDAVELPGMGAIGLTFCPGKTDPYGLAGPHDRDLGADLRAMAHWEADHLVTLIEAREFDHLGVGELGEAAEMAGMDWSWLPIPDGGVPDDDFERRWLYDGLRLRRIIRRGGRVVVHCRGGLGRAGLVAGRLLVELGWDPEAALKSVRRARPGAVETAGQERYLRALRPGERSEEQDNRVLGALVGGALGDGFGYAVEFWSEDQIRAEFGGEGMANPQLTRQGELVVSDDTQMTLFTLAGLLEAGPPGEVGIDDAVAKVRTAYLAWLETQEGTPTLQTYGAIDQLATGPRLQQLRAPGLTCLDALRDGGGGTPEYPANDSKGCGGVMRVAPVGLVPGWSAEQAYEVGAKSAALTHGHPAGYAAAGAMAAMVRHLAGGQSLSEATVNAFPLVVGELGAPEVHESLRQALERARVPSEDPFDDVRALGEGWVAEEALAIGVYAALRGRDFPDVVRIAASHGGDSDSTAAIAGQLYGVWQGVHSMPHAWVRRLDVLSPLLMLVERF